LQFSSIRLMNTLWQWLCNCHVTSSRQPRRFVFLNSWSSRMSSQVQRVLCRTLPGVSLLLSRLNLGVHFAILLCQTLEEIKRKRRAELLTLHRVASNTRKRVNEYLHRWTRWTLPKLIALFLFSFQFIVWQIEHVSGMGCVTSRPFCIFCIAVDKEASFSPTNHHMQWTLSVYDFRFVLVRN
jgi:hypothetical protein